MPSAPPVPRPYLQGSLDIAPGWIAMATGSRASPIAAGDIPISAAGGAGSADRPELELGHGRV